MKRLIALCLLPFVRGAEKLYVWILPPENQMPSYLHCKIIWELRSFRKLLESL